MSFHFDVTGKGPNKVLPRIGNSAVIVGKWHWDSSSGGDATIPGTEFLRVDLNKGPLTFRIYEREGSGLNSNPWLDVILLTDDQNYKPTDEDAKAGLEEQKKKAEAVQIKGKLPVIWGSIKYCAKKLF